MRDERTRAIMMELLKLTSQWRIVEVPEWVSFGYKGHLLPEVPAS